MKRRQAVISAVLATAMLGCKEKATETGLAAADAVVVIGPENIAVAKLTELRSGPPVSGSLIPRTESRVRAEIGGPVK